MNHTAGTVRGGRNGRAAMVCEQQARALSTARDAVADGAMCCVAGPPFPPLGRHFHLVACSLTALSILFLSYRLRVLTALLVALLPDSAEGTVQSLRIPPYRFGLPSTQMLIYPRDSNTVPSPLTRQLAGTNEAQDLRRSLCEADECKKPKRCRLQLRLCDGARPVGSRDTGSKTRVVHLQVGPGIGTHHRVERPGCRPIRKAARAVQGGGRSASPGARTCSGRPAQ